MRRARTFSLVFTGLLALGMVGAAIADETANETTPARVEESATVPAAGMMVAIDPETGALRQPTAEESRQAAEAMMRAITVPLTSGQTIQLAFNGDIGVNPNCLTGRNWYNGFDGNEAANEFDLLAVVAHEIAHGLGFLDLVSSSGAFFNGQQDIYSTFLFDITEGKFWPELDNPGRATSTLNDLNLVWGGPSVSAAAPAFLGPRPVVDIDKPRGLGELEAQPAAFGPAFPGGDDGDSDSDSHRRKVKVELAFLDSQLAGTQGGLARMYAPDPFRGGSSTAHWDVTATPNLLMEPFINSDLGTQTVEGLDLTPFLFDDIGWPNQAEIPEGDDDDDSDSDSDSDSD